MKPEVEQVIRDGHARGLTLAAIGAQLHLTKERIRQLAGMLGLEFSNLRVRRALEAAKEVRQYMTVDQLADKVGLSPSTIRRHHQNRPPRNLMPCGTLASYRRGCHCERCTAANAAAAREYRQRTRARR